MPNPLEYDVSMPVRINASYADIINTIYINMLHTFYPENVQQIPEVQIGVRHAAKQMYADLLRLNNSQSQPAKE